MRETLGEAYDPRSNSIGAMRLIAASFVVIGHAFGHGGYGADPLAALTGNQAATGRWPVDVFFVLSGFLLVASFQRTSLLAFAKARFLRIYPAYWVNLIICGVVVPLAFGAAASWAFVARGVPLILYVDQTIPGVFENNFRPQVNGPLWTLPIELFCYITIPIAAAFGFLTRHRVLIVFGGLWALFIAQIFTGFPFSPIASPLRLATFFYAGAALYLWRDHIPLSAGLALGAGAGLAVFTITGTLFAPFDAGLFYVAAPAFLSYLTVYAAAKLNWTRLNSKTDISYGIYIYGTLCLQILTATGYNSLPYPIYVALAFAMCVPMALASWFLIEKPALGLKDRHVQRLARA